MAANDTGVGKTKDTGSNKGKTEKRSRNFGKKISKSVGGIRLELKKVTWPTWRELFNYTVTVLIVCVLMGILIYLLDLGLTEVLRYTLEV